MTNGANSTVIACSGGGGSGSGFLGSFTTAPTANTTGDTYFNTADNTYYYYDGTTWQPVFTNNFLGNSATPPAGATAGSVYYNTTTNTLMVYNGTTWVPLSGDASMLGSFATAPTATITGDTYYNTTDNGVYQWDGTNWVLQFTVSGGGADASNLGSFSTAPTANKIGDSYFNTTDNGYYQWDGTNWVLQFTVGGGGGGSFTVSGDSAGTGVVDGGDTLDFTSTDGTVFTTISQSGTTVSVNLSAAQRTPSSKCYNACGLLTLDFPAWNGLPAKTITSIAPSAGVVEIYDGAILLATKTADCNTGCIDILYEPIMQTSYAWLYPYI